MFQQGILPKINYKLPSLKLTAKAPEKGHIPKMKGSSPNHQFSGASAVNVREGDHFLLEIEKN